MLIAATKLRHSGMEMELLVLSIQPYEGLAATRTSLALAFFFEIR